MIPSFTIHGYGALLDRLIDLGYKLKPAILIPDLPGTERTVYLRHDVDIHLEGALEIAIMEEVRGARSCWYVATGLEYNPGSTANAKMLRSLAVRGHAIGLHYMPNQPSVREDAEYLSHLSGYIVTQYVMHRPSSRGVDHLALSTNNPHHSGIDYISDSRMQWVGGRLERLLADNGPNMVLLNTHHEHWLGNGRYNTGYLKMLEVIERSSRRYLINLMEG